MAGIAVDIDSTLYDFETPSREAMFRLYKETGDAAYKEGAYHPWTEWRSPADVLGVEKWLKAIALVHDADVIETMHPFPGAVETCQALANAGHKLLYISNRATEALEATEAWLYDHGFLDGKERPEVLCLMGDKAPHMRECQYIIDDRLKTVVEFIHDYDWKTQVERGAQRIINSGPDADDPLASKWDDAISNTLDMVYDDSLPRVERHASRDYWLRMANEIATQAADAYRDRNKRRAFVKGYAYNQAGTDIPGLYIAPTWAGLNEYLVSKGVLPEPAAIPLGVLG